MTRTCAILFTALLVLTGAGCNSRSDARYDDVGENHIDDDERVAVRQVGGSVPAPNPMDGSVAEVKPASVIAPIAQKVRVVSDSSRRHAMIGEMDIRD